MFDIKNEKEFKEKIYKILYKNGVFNINNI